MAVPKYESVVQFLRLGYGSYQNTKVLYNL